MNARTRRNEAWSEFAKAEMALRDAERWLAEVEHAARLAGKVAA
jgi:hypothetical protein